MKKLVFAFLMMCVSGVCAAQTSTGGLTGQVIDSQHALVPGATVIVRNVQTNAEINLVSNRSGIYSTTSLPAGSYRVIVQKAGFEEEIVDDVVVNIASTSKVNVELKTGQVKSTVTVDADGQLLTTVNATISTVIPNVIASGLPYPEQSALEAVTLVPGVQGDPQYSQGVQSENPPVYTQPTTPGGSLAIGGGRPGSTEELVDGFDVTAIGYPRAGITFSGYTINQVTVQVNGITAQYGRTGGGIINQSTASGGAQYHGLVAYRHYDPYFEAATYGQGGKHQALQQNIFSGTFGGPVPVPGLRKNTFFFASYEPLRSSNTLYSRIRVPTPDELAGNFQNAYTLLDTSVLRSQGYAAAIAAPRVGGLYYQFPTNANGFTVGVPYTDSSQYVPIPNNSVAAQLAQNPLAKFVLSQFPTPDKPTRYMTYLHSDASYDNDGANAIGNRGVDDRDDRYNIRVDHSFRNGDRMFARYTNVPVSGTRYNFLGPDSIIQNQPQSKIVSQNGVLDYTHIFSNNRVNDARISYLLLDYRNTPAPAALTQDYAKQLGLTPSPNGNGFPTISIDTGTYGSASGGNDGGESLNEAYSIGDDFSLLVGKHTISFGGEFRALQLNRTDNKNLYGGRYGFTGGSTNDGDNGGNATASFILGQVDSLGLATPQTYYYRSKYAALYFQDSWQLTPKLTLNAGLRYSLETPRSEAANLQGSLDPNATGSLNGVAATGGFVFSGTNGRGNRLWPTNYKGFEPRIGVAYQPRPAMTVRASYGLIHAPLTGVTNSITPALIVPALQLGGQFGGADPNQYLNYITNPLSLPGGIPGVLRSQAPVFNTSFVIPDIKQSSAVPYIQAWSLSTQYQLGKGTLIEAAYTGQVGRHLFQQPIPENIVPENTFLTELAQHANFNDYSVPNKYGLGTGDLNTNLVPYPQFIDGVSSAFDREGSSNYHAFYLSGMQNLAGGLTLLSSFTWSKSMDDGSSGTQDNITTDTFGFVGPQNPYARNVGEYSYSTFDTPARVTAGYVWNIPVGRGTHYLTGSNRLVDALVGGWSTSGIFSAQSGYPISVRLGTAGYFVSTAPDGGVGENGNDSPYNLRPNIVPGQPLIKSNWKSDPYGKSGGGFLNAAAFSVPGSVDNPQLGNAARTLGGARSPRTIYFDASLRKSFSVTSNERVKLTVKLDALNALNHTNFFFGPNGGHTLSGSLNSDTGIYTLNSGFGALSSGAQAPGRTVALGASLSF